MKNTLFLLLGVSLLFSSCNKKTEGLGIFITGKIVDPYSGEVVPDVQVVISENRIDNGAYSSSYYPVDTVYSDANGQYQIEVIKKNTVAYQMDFSKDGFYPTTFREEIDYFSTSEENEIDIDLFTKSTVHFNFVNVGTTSESDTFIFNKRSGKTDCGECCPNGITEYTGANIDEDYFCAVNGGSFLVYEYTLATSDQNGFYRDSVFCPVNDTAEVTIEF